LFIIGAEASSLAADNRTPILDRIVADGYMMAQLVYKVLLSRRAGFRHQVSGIPDTVAEGDP
jgi:hypothetical protein